MKTNKTRNPRKYLPDRGPLRYRMRAKLLYQGKAIPAFVRAYLRQQFPRMCEWRARAGTGGA